MWTAAIFVMAQLTKPESIARANWAGDRQAARTPVVLPSASLGATSMGNGIGIATSTAFSPTRTDRLAQTLGSADCGAQGALSASSRDSVGKLIVRVDGAEGCPFLVTKLLSYHGR